MSKYVMMSWKVVLIFGFFIISDVTPLVRASSNSHSLQTTTSQSLQTTTILGDYDKAPRNNGRVDIDKLIERLNKLGANTYMWLIWHGSDDWQDLKLFLPKAQHANIKVWVYLVPPSETPANNGKYAYSEPFRLNYIRWAQEIGRLSISYPNLVGYVIDDFWGNSFPAQKASYFKFTPSYVERMVIAGRAINPNLLFYPLMYFNQLENQKFTHLYAPLVDGVVVAYPSSQAAVRNVSSAVSKVHLTSGRRFGVIVMVPVDVVTMAKYSHFSDNVDMKSLQKIIVDMLELARDGVVDGIVTYCLDKNNDNEMFNFVAGQYVVKRVR